MKINAGETDECDSTRSTSLLPHRKIISLCWLSIQYMMLHTKSKFADPAVNFSQILPIRWFCEVFYQHNIDTKNDVRMYRCFPVINTLLRLWLILLTSFLYPCPFIGALVGKGREGLQTIICFWKNARKRLFQHLSQEKRKSNSVFTCFFFFLNLLVFY